MAKNVNMTAGHPGRLLFFFALPLMFGNVFQQFYTVVDTAIVGRGVGMDALAALYLLYVYRSALEGMGKTNISLVSGIVEFSVRVGGAVIIGFTLVQNGIFYAEVGAWIGAAILLSIAYYHHVAKLGK